MALLHEGATSSRRAAMVSIAEKTDCTTQTLNEWIEKTQVDAAERAGKRDY